MREVILLSVIFTVLQIVDVSFAAVTLKATKTTKLANLGKNAPKTSLLTKATLKRTTWSAVDSDEDGDVTENGRERFAAADAECTDPSKVSSGQLGRLLGNFVRDQLKRNAVRVAEFKAGLLSGLGDRLTDGLFDYAMRTAAPLKTTSQALKGVKRGAAAPSRTTKTSSNAALSVVGIHSDETDAEDGRPTARADDDDDVEEEDEVYGAPQSSLKTKRAVSIKIKN